jgi:poly-gamma-glutamate capsule biosynthesis protein CapA/YwtB (metallophosphatase superfamily)
VPLAFIGYNQFQSFVDGAWEASTTTEASVRAAREQGYFPIVFAHWGEEYVPAGERQKRLARAWIDAGAEMVIGAHPHVVQEHEEYAGKHIYYSLGNFIFDQYWEDAVRNGLLVEVRIGKNGVEEVREIQTRLERDRRTCIVQ